MLFGVPFLRLLISIHALREESDVLAQAIEVANQISIHALREESDAWSRGTCIASKRFQSTLSVRRATYPMRR